MSNAPDGLSVALDAVVTRFGGLLRAIGRRYGLPDADADELTQEVRIRLWRAQGAGERILSVTSSYVYRTATSAAVDMIRRRRARKSDPVAIVPDSAPGAQLPEQPSAALERSELGEQILRAISRLAPARQTAVRMHLAGYPREEIAQLLGWTDAKVRNLIYRGLADLRGWLEREGVRPEG